MAIERTEDPGIIEQRLLEFAYETDANITPPSLAYYSHCSIDDAEQVLETLAARNRISMEVDDAGNVFYNVPNRRKLTPREEPLALNVIRPTSLPLALRGGRAASPALAALLSLVIPGAGQLYAGRPLAAALWLIFVAAGYVLFLPGVLLHIWCIGAAAGAAHRLNSNLYQRYLMDPDLAPRASH
ncbi:MAG TPA: hypothetical protein VGM39_18540 [Kofleriaceae bacterium]|jgi:TM2 domain-containing membrane protein YozV